MSSAPKDLFTKTVWESFNYTADFSKMLNSGATIASWTVVFSNAATISHATEGISTDTFGVTAKITGGADGENAVATFNAVSSDGEHLSIKIRWQVRN